MKTCNKCGQQKELELFAKGARYKDGRRNVCKRCHTDYVLQYYKDNPDKHLAKIKMNTYYKPSWKRHNMTEEQYYKLYNLYDGKCHSCKDRSGNNVDHDHKCCPGSYSCGYCVRGLLCKQCNTALGSLKDDIQKIKNLLEYIS